LSYGAPTIVGDEIGGMDGQSVQQAHQHVSLRGRRQILLLTSFGVSQSHEVWGDATPVF
jgi:hypothetical protein